MLKRNLLAVLSIALIVFLTACEKPHDSGTNYKSKFVDGVLVEGERGKLGQAFESSMSFFSTKDKKRPFDGENLIVETPSENMLNSRGRFGVIIGADITPAIKEALNLGSSDGALVSDVEENSPAEKIGLKAGDVIISFNGVAIKEATDLPNAVGLMEIGNIYNITYLRKERKIENKIEIEAYSSPGFEQGVTLVEREGLLYIKFSSNPYTGSFSVYYENGKVSKTINVRDGLFDGPFIEYHENGQLQAKGSWKNGKYNDLYEEYYQSGEQKLKAFFTDGKFQECEGEGCASFKTVYNGKKLYEKSLKYLKENPKVAITAAKLGVNAACLMGNPFFCF